MLKEREAQIELNKRIKSASEDVEKEFLNLEGTRQDEALRKEEEKVVRRKLEKLAVAEELKKQ